ncbi:MAG TPA: antitermination protein NusG [Planctomycetaceae bacterium]|nr:antitermination protein NusG [Planctomycetaceae bacterium]
MSIRVGSPELFPDDLLSDLDESGSSEPDPRRAWWTIYTRSRQEKALARELAARRISFFLPLINKKTQYGRRTITSSLPLFPNYVFLFGSEEDRVASLATNRVSRILAVSNGDDLRRDLIHVRRLIASGVPLTVESRWTPGQRVRVKRGPLMGLEGTILRRQGQTRLLVSVDFLQQGASVAIEDFLLEAISDGVPRRSGKIEYR